MTHRPGRHPPQPAPGIRPALGANLYRLVRRGTVLEVLRGREPFHWVAPGADIVELGSRYGRWAVSTAGLSSGTTMVSFGLGQDISFEQALLGRAACSIHGFDPTPASVSYLQGLGPIPGLSLRATALAAFDGTLEFLLPPGEAGDQVSASAAAAYAGTARVTVACLTLRSALRACGLAHADIVKMDIEGAEYEVLNQALDSSALDGTRQLMVEFHHFLPGLKADQTRQIIGRLRQSGFRIGWVGRTNHEYLFLRER